MPILYVEFGYLSHVQAVESHYSASTGKHYWTRMTGPRTNAFINVATYGLPTERLILKKFFTRTRRSRMPSQLITVFLLRELARAQVDNSN